jgi:hypothetical protein
MARFRFLTGPTDFSLLYTIQIPSGTTQPPSNVYQGFFPWRVKLLEREADHSLPSSAEVKNGGAIPPL